MMSLLILIFEFFKIGLFSIGGGLLLMGDSRISAGVSGRRGAVSCLGRHFA